MAYGEFGGLLPRETHFSSPVAYTEAAKAEAVKRASYLSQMDQFYAQLAESTRQFDLTLSWQKDAFGQQMGLEREKLSWEKEYGTEALALQRLGIETQRYGIDKNYSLGMTQAKTQRSIAQAEIDLKKQEMSYQQKLASAMLPYASQNMALTNQSLALDVAKKSSSLQKSSSTTSSLSSNWLDEYLNKPYSLPSTSGSSSNSYLGSLTAPGSYSYSYGGQTYGSSSDWYGGEDIY